MSSQSSIRVVFLVALIWAASLFAIPFGLHIIFYNINLATNYSLDPFTNGFVPAMLFGLTAAGGLAGYWTARLLKRKTRLPALRVFLVTLGWSAAMFLSVFIMFQLSSLFMPPESPPLPPGAPEPTPPGLPLFVRVLARDFVLSLIPGILGGLVLALEIRRGMGINGWKMAQITTSWGIGFALGGMLGNVEMNLMNVLTPFGVDSGWVVQDVFIWLNYAITGLIAGAFGAWVTTRVVQPTDPISQSAAPSFHAPSQ